MKRGRAGANVPPSRGAPLSPSMPGSSASSSSGLVFQFWDDRKFQSYGAPEQKFFTDRFAEVPIPTTVQLPGGKYEVQNFDGLAVGKAVQVNVFTKFERALRLKPPYSIVGASPLAALSSISTPHFQFLDERGVWRDYSPQVQQELHLAMQCAPSPSQVLFATEGKAYWLLGLDTFEVGKDICQINLKTGTARPVHILSGPPAPLPPSIARAATTTFGRLQRSVTSALDFSAVPCRIRSPPSFKKGDGEFRICTRPNRGGHMANVFEAIDPAAQNILRQAWLHNPRPEQVMLPDGHVIENFHKLELDGAGCWNTSAPMQVWMPLELHVPAPSPGRVSLPAELDEDTTFELTNFGTFLTDAEIAALPQTNGSKQECAICRCDLEDADDGTSNNDNSNAASSNNAPHSHKAFKLQCGHVYHCGCLQQWFESRRRCPECQKDFGKVIGDQPRQGTLEWHVEHFQLPGHRAKDTIVFEFIFPAGVSDAGVNYDGRKPKGYLPANLQGLILLELFKVAFRRRVMFGLGQSMTLGVYRPTFNIHIKTSTHRGMAGHGYPDDDYFSRSLEELRTNGVTMVDLPE